MPQPWRNGGGVTREMLAWPTPDDWLVRFSIADIERAGPFSSFPNIDRWFAVLSGNGVRLGASETVIKRGDEAVNFDGALAPDCMLIDGATRDLNLMIRRDTASGWMKRIAAGFEFAEAGEAAAVQGIFAADSCTLRSGKSPAIMVGAMSLVWRNSTRESEKFATPECAPAALVFAFQCVVDS